MVAEETFSIKIPVKKIGGGGVGIIFYKEIRKQLGVEEGDELIPVKIKGKKNIYFKLIKRT